MARKADNKAPAVSVLEGDIAFARNDIGKACQLYEQAIYFDSNYKDAYLKYAQAYKSAMDPETTEGLAKPYYEKVVDVLLAKNEPRYNSALIECYSYLGYYYLLKSDYATSKEYWNKILAIDPTNATANKALDGIK